MFNRNNNSHNADNSYFAVCLKCQSTYFVDDPQNKHTCAKCGGKVVTGNPLIREKDFNSSNSFDYIRQVFDTWEDPSQVRESIQKYGECYEYKTVSIEDEEGGFIYTQEMNSIIREHSIEGWRLITAYCNELGRNSVPKGLLLTYRENSTICQHILVFERKIV